MAQHTDTFRSRQTLRLGGQEHEIFHLAALGAAGFPDIDTLPFSLRVLLENLLRHEDGQSVTAEDISAVARWDSTASSARELAFRPARVLLQDFTGVPAVVDLAAMRESFATMGGDPAQINPLQAADLVIDHSVQVDEAGSLTAFGKNIDLEFARNRERYQFLKWGQQAFRGLSVVPPGTGIVHQVNLEYLAQVVCTRTVAGRVQLYPDTLVGTDSHTTMINGIGVLGWGVGGIEAEAAMLGMPIGMLLPQVVGVRLRGQLREGATATDLVLTVTERLRAHGVVGKFVEFCGPGLTELSLPDRATVANMAPEYGATMGFFPVDEESLAYLRMTGRSDAHIAVVRDYLKAQGLLRDAASPEPRFSELLDVDLAEIEPSIAGPKRPQDRIALSAAKRSWRQHLKAALADEIDEAARPQADAWARAEASGPT
ncbi:MAG: aconitate hydratase, partial [Polyangiales bacterium]